MNVSRSRPDDKEAAPRCGALRRFWMTDRDISASDLASFGTPCRLPTQACQGCNEFFLDADLQELEEGSVLLYCAECLFDKSNRAQPPEDQRD